MKKKPLIITIAAVAVIALAVTLIIAFTQCNAERYEYENAEKYTVGDFSQTVQVGAIDVEWLDGSVEVVVGGVYGISCYEDSEIPIADDTKMRTWFDGSVLRIRPAASGTKLDKIPKKTLTIVIPQGHYFNDVDILAASADVKIDQAGARFASVTTSSGKIEFNHFGDSKDVRLTSSSGDVSYKHSINSVESLEITTADGNISISDVNPAKKLTAVSSSGSVSLTLPEDSGFTLTAETTGVISYGGFTGEALGNKLVVGSGSAEVTLKSSSGAITLKKK